MTGDKVMAEQAVLYKLENAVATVTFNRPDALNSMSWELLNESVAVFRQIEADEKARVVVLTGAGKGFCAGGDLPTILKLSGTIEQHKYISAAGEFVTAIRYCKKPVIAMVNGAAAGAGFNVVLACDIAIASTKARFAQSFANVGLVPDAGGFYSLPRLVGLSKAKELMLTADLIDAAEALRLGLVNKVVEPEQLGEVSYNLAAKLAKGAPLVMALIKNAVNNSLESDWSTMQSLEASIQTMCLATEDNKEGVKAFFEKRPPNFPGK
jgi:2-(1,2-epoxy-1,2-dihydrophenyl)acetyl-CoA isomerase